MKQMGLIGAVSTLIGTMVGAAVFVLLGSLASQTGTSLMLAFLIGAIPAFLASVYYIQLSNMIPTTGGSFVYAKRLLNPTSGTIVGFFLVFAGVGAVGMLALGLVDYLSFYFERLNPILIGGGAVVLFIIINSLGVGIASKLQIIMVAWMLIALIVFIVTGFWAYSSGEVVATQTTPFLLNGPSGLLMASVVAFYSYAGYGLITEIGGKLKNPRRNAPLSIAISLTVVTIIYVLVAYVALKVVNLEEFIGFAASLPMTAQLFLPEWLVNFIAIGGILAIVTTMNAVLIVIPEELAVMAEHKVIHPIFGQYHPKFGSPVASLLLIGVLAIGLIVCGISGTVFSTMTVVGLLMGSIFMGVTMLSVMKNEPELYASASMKLPKSIIYLCSILGVTTSFLFTIIAILDAPIVGVLAIMLIVSSILYMKVRKSSINLQMTEELK